MTKKHAKYTFHLTDDERDLLRGVIKRQAGTSLKIRRAQIMLKADASGPGWTDGQIAEAFSCPTKTVARIRQRVVENGVDAALANQKEGAPAHSRLLNGDQEARIIAEGMIGDHHGEADGFSMCKHAEHM